MIDYKKYFKDKKITIMGLGLLGRGLGYTKFLAECGANLLVTDLKTEEQLKSSLKELRKYKNIKYTLGGHKLEDFKGKDMIIKAAGVPMDSLYIKEARKNKIQIEMDVSLFAKCAPEISIIGVTGTRGKSMTTTLIYEILKKNESFLKKKIFIGGNIRGVATLPLLSKVKAGDILVCELDSWQLQGFGEEEFSPQISVFTTFMPDHMNYYNNDLKKYFDDKANIFKYQKKGDMLVIRPNMKKLIPKSIKSRLIVVNQKEVADWSFIVPGEHQRENLALAVEVAKQFNIKVSKIKSVIKNFKGIEGRLEYLKTIRGVKIYNDNNATTPEATIAGLEALGNNKKNIVLIAGGADKGLDLKLLSKVINKYCKALVMINGTGTEKLLKEKISTEKTIVYNLKDAIKEGLEYTSKGGVILFSPGFASFGMFNNEYERNDQFVKIIKKLK